MSSGNWVIDNLNNALQTWNDKMSEIWLLVTQSPTEFKGGGIWNVIVNIHGALQATGLALLVLFLLLVWLRHAAALRKSKTRKRLEAVHPLCLGQRRSDLWAGLDDGTVQHCAGNYLHHYEQRGLYYYHTNRPAGHNYTGCRRLQLLAEYTTVGGDVDRWFVHYGAVLHYDSVGVRAVF